MNKKMAAAGLVAGLVAGAGAGLVLELSGTAGAASTITATDETTGTDTDETTDPATRYSEHLQEALQPLVDAGTIDQAQADAVIAALEEARPEGRGGRLITVAAETIGISEDEVRAALQDGQTLAELAVANGSSADALVTAILADMKAHLDEHVADGEMTQEEADARLADATERVTEMVNSTLPDRPFGGRGGHGGRGGFGGFGD